MTEPTLDIPHRLDRLVPLAEMTSYPGSPFVDTVFYWPLEHAGGHARVRLWLCADGGAEAEIELNRMRFAPVGCSASDESWIDFGTHDVAALQEGQFSFGILRCFGLHDTALRDGVFVATTQVEKELGGDRSTVEETLWGISRWAVGSSSISPTTVTVGEETTFTMRYITGPGGLPPGALLRLAFPKLYSMPQTEDENAPGWLYVGASRTCELVSIDTSRESHERIDAIYRLPEGLPLGGMVQAVYHTSDMYLFPMRWERMERRYWYSHLPVMSVAVAVDERRIFVPPEEGAGHAVQLAADAPERLHLFLPGRVRAGAPVFLRGLYTDRFRNSPPRRGPLPGPVHLVLESPGGDVELGAAEKRFTRWYRFELPLNELGPGLYRARAVHARTGAVLARSNPLEVMAADDGRPCVFWGEIHGHSEQSDGSGDFAGIYEHARDEGALDFAASGDHACYFSDNEWQWMQDVTASFNEGGRFATLIGYEWAGQQGHRNVYTDKDRLELFRGMYPGTRRLDAVYDHFDGREDVVAGPHVHHTRDFFAFHNPAVQRFLEICSMWGVFEELVFDAVARGARIGFTGGGDCHEGHCGFSVEDPDRQGTRGHTFAPGLRYKCGMTAALLPALDRRELLQALRSHRIYATTGARMLLDFSVADVDMGGEGVTRTAPVVEGVVHCASPIDRTDVVRDGEVAMSVAGSGCDAHVTWTDADVAPGEHWYVLKAVQDDGEVGWSSPVWMTVSGER